jgi:hypothetical protein
MNSKLSTKTKTIWLVVISIILIALAVLVYLYQVGTIKISANPPAPDIEEVNFDVTNLGERYYDQHTFAIDNLGNPHIVMINSDTKERYHRYLSDAGEWVDQDIGFAETSQGYEPGSDIKIALDSNNYLHLLYQEYNGNSQMGQNIYYTYYDGSSWQSKTFTSQNGIPPLPKNIYIDDKDHVHILYSEGSDDSNINYYKYFDGENWQDISLPFNDSSTEHIAPFYGSFVVDCNGYAHTLAESGSDYYYCYYDGNSWTNEKLDVVNNYNNENPDQKIGLDRILLVGTTPIIIGANQYYQNSMKTLGFYKVYKNNGSWELENIKTVYNFPTVRIYSIAADRYGGLHYITNCLGDKDENSYLVYNYQDENSTNVYNTNIPVAYNDQYSGNSIWGVGGPPTLIIGPDNKSNFLYQDNYVLFTGDGVDPNQYKFAQTQFLSEYSVVPTIEETDTDNDGIPDSEDDDIDGDGIPNSEDDDIDGDGIPNEEDSTPEGADSSSSGGSSSSGSDSSNTSSTSGYSSSDSSGIASVSKLVSTGASLWFNILIAIFLIIGIGYFMFRNEIHNKS